MRGLSLAALSRESETLGASLAAADRAQTALAMESKPRLIAASGTLERVLGSLESLLATAPELGAALPALEAEAAAFAPVSDRSASAALLANVDKILDVLELPALVLTCVQNGYYAEALDLVGHVRRLAIRFHDVGIVRKVQAEVDGALLEMTTTLLRLLRENVQLPTAIKVVAYLRRLPPFQTAPDATLQLQHIYLLSRSTHLRGQYAALKPLRPMPEKYLKRYIELFREHVFAAVVGFHSIFPAPAGGDAAADQLLASFVHHAVADLSARAHETLPHVADPTTRATLRLQAIYSSQSLARVRGEFWPVLAAPAAAAPWVAAVAKQRELARRIKPL
ncbi:oligomeric Golgi complex subunit 8 [Dipodascopsis tothii]|uniref:oligomeric Golgi complex subunit 8 n=1 Tax=Dipodascopsis tothii TaxID=44089 RepID=UPI0034CE2711